MAWNMSVKKAESEEQKRRNIDHDTREYINHSQSDECMREFICDHFRPKPNHPGFQWHIKPANSDHDEMKTEELDVMWEVNDLVLTRGALCGCSAKCCCANPNEAIGLLTDDDRVHIQHLMDILQPSTSVAPSTSNCPQLRCSKPERENLKEQLEDWRDHQWTLVADEYPFFSRDWILSDEDLKRFVDKAHVVLNSTGINQQFLGEISKWSLISPCPDSLCQLLEDFRVARLEREAAEALERPRKRKNKHFPTTDLFLDPFIEGQPFVVNPQAPALPGMQLTWNLSAP